jgi:hypothetical protein
MRKFVNYVLKRITFTHYDVMMITSESRFVANLWRTSLRDMSETDKGL